MANTFRDIIDNVSGLRFIYEKLEIQSGLGRRFLLSQEFLINPEQISNELNNVEAFIIAINIEQNIKISQNISFKLQQIHDIHGTVRNLSHANTLDDIELFEIKQFCILSSEISQLLRDIHFKTIEIPNLENLIKILDPDGLRIPQFYIYSSYDDELALIRKKQKEIHETNPELAEELYFKSIEIEDKIRQQLSRELFDYANVLFQTLRDIAYIDVLLAKSKYFMQNKFSKPQIASENTEYIELFNPQIKEILLFQSKNFQAIDIVLFASPCLITGVNMGGKTVLLKTIALSQYLYQFGFYIPAKSASIVPVEKIMLSMGDEQSELSGMSSFAAEMMNVNEIINAVKQNTKVLALIDELARTTNPEEGKAIVNATIDILESKKVRSLITTHYNGLQTHCRKLRVKGLIAEKISETLSIKNINDFMDYSLVDNNSEIATMQALQIAEILGVNEDLLVRANLYLKK